MVIIFEFLCSIPILVWTRMSKFFAIMIYFVEQVQVGEKEKKNDYIFCQAWFRNIMEIHTISVFCPCKWYIWRLTRIEVLTKPSSQFSPILSLSSKQYIYTANSRNQRSLARMCKQSRESLFFVSYLFNQRNLHHENSSFEYLLSPFIADRHSVQGFYRPTNFHPFFWRR